MSKHDNISEFDKFIQGSLEGAKVPAPQGVWEGISAASSAASAAGQAGLLAKIGGIKGLIITGSVAVVATLTTLVLTNKDTENTEPVQIEEQGNLVQNTEKGNTESTPYEVDRNDEDSSPESRETISEGGPGNSSTAPRQDQTQHNSSTDNPIISDQGEERTESRDDDHQDVDQTEAAPLEFAIGRLTICENESCEARILEDTDVDYYWLINGAKITGKKVINVEPVEPGEMIIRLISFPNGKKTEFKKSVFVYSSKPSITSDQIQRGFYSFKTEKSYESYEWNFVSIDKRSNEANPKQYFDYQTYATTKLVLWTVNANGCKDSAHKTVSFVEAPFIPNAFTPYEQDGRNDKFKVVIAHETLYKMVVFDSRGQIVFESNSKDQNWDGTDMTTGKMMPPGAYTYKFVYQQVGERQKVKQGTIHLFK